MDQLKLENEELKKQLNQSIFDSQEKSRMAKQIEILNEVYYK